MKRKYLSALLMGTLTVASMSTFTSCKDYDDDISNLQGQIDKLATADQLSQKVAELQALISSNTSSIGTLQSALDEAKKAAEKAQTTADSKATLDQVNGILADYAKVSYVDDAKKSLNDAIEALKTGDIATLKADVEAAAKAAEKAKADAEAAIAEVKKDLADNYVKNATFESEKTAVQAALETLTNQVQTNTGNIQKNADAIVKLQAVDVVTKADLVAKLGEYATAQQAKDLQKELTDLKNNFAEEIAKYALKSDLNSLATKDELKKASEKAANDLQTKLNDYLKADVLASLATKDDIKDLQNKEAVQNLIKEAIRALKDGDIKSIGDKAAEALQKANKAESTEGLAYVKALAAEGKAVAAGEDAATAKSKAEANESEIATIKNILGNNFDAKNTVSAAIELINSQLTNDKTGLAALAGRLSSIESLLNQDTPDATSLKTRVDNIENKLKDIIGQYSTMVTDVQLFDFAPGSAATGFDQKLNFIQATEQANVFPGAGVADAQFTFEKGKYFAGEDSLLIRVSPVDAELTTSNVSLLNSQGKELNDLIEVTGAHRYNGLIYGADTRAGVDANTGLWVVKFKAKDLGEAFDAAAKVKVGNANKSILYSVAVKNTYTTDEAKDRRVTSEYGVSLWTEEAKHAYDFKVNDTSIKDIKNRTAMYTAVDELDWKDNSKPATTVITTGKDANAGKNATTADNRNSGAKILAVEEGGDIVIDFTKQIPGLSAADQNKDFGVKGFYVTLDEKFALESGVSEINAWRSYTYENVGYKKNGTTTVPAHLFPGNQGTIRIQKLGNAKGDVIGFRVYAVNYDGTLTDPDGRAFYVAVGDAKVDMTIPTTTVSIDMATANDENPTFESALIPVDFSKYDFDASNYTWKVTAKDKDGKEPNAYFKVKYYLANGSETPNLSKDVKSVQFVLTRPNEFIDGETYTVSTTLQKNFAGATADVSTVTASFKKEMPTAAPTFGYRDGFDKFEYIIPTDDYTVNPADAQGNIPNKSGKFDFRNILIINNNSTAWNGIDLFGEGVFNFNVANGTYKYENRKYVLDNATATINGSAKYILNVNNGGANLVDNETERTITADFVYKNISKQYVKQSDGTMAYEKVLYKKPSPSSEKIVYCSWMKTFNVADKGGDNWIGRDEVKKNNTVVVTKIDPANVVTWSPTAQVNTLYLNKVDAKVADLKAIPTSVASTVKGTNLAAFFDTNVIALVKGTYGEVWTTSTDEKQINPYFTAEIVNGKILLTQNNQTAIPSNVKGGLIHFTVRDCFGNTQTIKLPFVINMPEVTARKH